MSPHGEYASDRNFVETPPAPKLTVVTVLEREAPTLLDAGRSVAVLAGLIGTPIEWVIACDGPVRVVWVASLLQRVDAPLLTIRVLGSVPDLLADPVGARDRALAAAHGRYLSVLDSDDRYGHFAVADICRQVTASSLDRESDLAVTETIRSDGWDAFPAVESSADFTGNFSDDSSEEAA